MADRLLSPEQVAEFGGFSLSSARRLFTAKLFPVIKIRRLIRVRESDFLAWLESETRRAQPLPTPSGTRTRRAERTVGGRA